MRHNTAKFFSVLALTVVALVGTACERASDVAGPVDAQFSDAATLRKVTSVTAAPGVAAKIIGASGDTLLITNNAGLHGIQVPAGAISRAAEFSIEFLGDGLDVRLNAVDARNPSNNIGEKGFKKPVMLCLNYTATGIDPTRLVIAQKLTGNRLAGVPTRIYYEQGYVCGDLQHFSVYTMAEN